MACEKRQDIDVLWSGHLNHNNINRILENEALKQRRFGAPKHAPPANLSKQQQQKEKPTFAPEDRVAVQDESLETSHQSIGHIDVPDNMHQLLEQFDSVKLNQKYNAHSSASDAEDDERVPPQPVNTATQFRSLEPKKELTKRRYLPAYQLNTTRHEQYKALKTADHDIVQSEWTRKKESLRSSKLSELSTFLKT
ncbi:hypothetical protein HDU80_011794, partial [Chytriomyces hyalinus]